MKLCGFDVGLNHRFFLIAGTCSIEGLEMSIDVAGQLKEICSNLGVPLIYKGSFDKANRSSGNTKRGVGIDALEAVGHYAVQPRFSDGHDTGIFTWEYLYKLGAEETALWQRYEERLAAAGASRDDVMPLKSGSACGSHH